MANPTWPATLPQFVLREGYDEQLANNKIETQMDAGLPKQRRRFTQREDQISVSWRMDRTQRDTFLTFYRSTLSDGTLAFDMPHPVSRATTTFRFRGESPKVAPVSSQYFTVSAKLGVTL